MTALAALRPWAIYPGIYAVTCAPARLVYVGQSRRAMRVRWDEHWLLLRLGRHANNRLQAAWNQHGERSFDVCILEVVMDTKQLDAREKYWIVRIGNANMRGHG